LEIVYREATRHYTRAFDLLEDLTAPLSQDAVQRRQLASVYAELSWFLTTHSDPELRSPQQALELAEMSVRQAPGVPRFRITLGLAHYRTGNWEACFKAFRKGRQLAHPGANTLPLEHETAVEDARLCREELAAWQRETGTEHADLREALTLAASLLEEKEVSWDES
jgi:hypothetical protein